MVGVNICGMCKSCIGLSEDKCNTLCKAYPEGIPIDASTVKECAPGYRFEAKDEYKDFCSKEIFIQKFA